MAHTVYYPAVHAAHGPGGGGWAPHGHLHPVHPPYPHIAPPPAAWLGPLLGSPGAHAPHPVELRLAGYCSPPPRRPLSPPPPAAPALAAPCATVQPPPPAAPGRPGALTQAPPPGAHCSAWRAQPALPGSAPGPHWAAPQLPVGEADAAPSTREDRTGAPAAPGSREGGLAAARGPASSVRESGITAPPRESGTGASASLGRRRECDAGAARSGESSTAAQGADGGRSDPGQGEPPAKGFVPGRLSPRRPRPAPAPASPGGSAPGRLSPSPPRRAAEQAPSAHCRGFRELQSPSPPHARDPPPGHAGAGGGPSAGADEAQLRWRATEVRPQELEGRQQAQRRGVDGAEDSARTTLAGEEAWTRRALLRRCSDSLPQPAAAGAAATRQPRAAGAAPPSRAPRTESGLADEEGRARGALAAAEWDSRAVLWAQHPNCPVCPKADCRCCLQLLELPEEGRCVLCKGAPNEGTIAYRCRAHQEIVVCCPRCISGRRARPPTPSGSRGPMALARGAECAQRHALQLLRRCSLCSAAEAAGRSLLVQAQAADRDHLATAWKLARNGTAARGSSRGAARPGSDAARQEWVAASRTA
eukprot:TRINITY_DN16272_c0_g1_i1.p1 TRINITY_DN16272_c0_g1~~TRINITY_DN16272_c0_g1_i1.p1  ORF type:complete len:589 (+),score=79.46 TRINITY_DN16272_c0_g1_i1:83-1849(+)